MIVDIHSHSLPKTGTKNKVIYNLNSDNAETSLASGYRGFLSIGVHPWYIENFSTVLFDKFALWTDDRRVIAIGECGLDKNRNNDLNKQIKVFEKQIELSEQKRKPVIIHCVGRFNELFELKKTWNPEQTWIIHGFRGKPQLAEQALKSGCKLSFGEHFNPESVGVVPLENLFLETDESNIPIEEIYRRVAEAKKCSVEELNAGEKLLHECVIN